MTFETSFQEAWIPRRPLAGQRAGPKHRMSREQALQLPYIETNPRALRSLVVVDRDETDTDQIADLLELPEPSWVAMNPHTRTGHVVFALASPVCLTDAARRPPVNLLARIEQGMTDVLGGDIGYAGKITKNPHHQDHLAIWGEASASYSLRQLARALGNVGALPERSQTGRALQDSTVGRNVALFHDVRKWAYPLRVKHTDAHEWDHVVETYAQEQNLGPIAEHFHKGAMSRAEVHHLAQSVSRWTWRNMSPELTAARRTRWAASENQQKRSQRAAEKRMIDREQARELF